MKKEYDFSNAEQGKFHRPREKLHIPIYLDGDIQKKLSLTGKRDREELSQLVNSILRKELEMSELLAP